MKKLMLVFITVMYLGACSILPVKEFSIIGEWVGIDTDGTSTSIIFNEDRSAEMIIKGMRISGAAFDRSVSWSLNTAYNPIHLDLIVSREARVDVVVPMIIRFHDDNTLEVRMTDDMKSRPERFLEADGINQILLYRR